MSTIKCICIDQALAFENTPVIASGSLDNHVSFTFCSLWNGYTKTAVFWRNEADAYHVILDSSGTCQLPPEVSDDHGTIYFGVFGVNGAGNRRTSNVLSYRIEKGAITVNTAPSEPTSDIYTQLLAMERAFEDHIKQLVVDSMVPDGSIATVKLASKSVTADKMADGSVTTAKLASKSITTEKLGDGVVDHILGKVLRVAVGSYVGTGGSGASAPNSLTFDFQPMLVVVLADSSYSHCPANLFIRGQGNSSGLSVIDSSTDSADLVLSWVGTTLSWYCDEPGNHPMLQLNEGGKTYRYFAIGMPGGDE